MIESTATAQEHTYVRTHRHEWAYKCVCVCVLRSFVRLVFSVCVFLLLFLPFFCSISFRASFCAHECSCVRMPKSDIEYTLIYVWYVCVQINVLIKFNELFSSVSFHSNLKHFSFSYCHSFTQIHFILFSLSLSSSFCCCCCCWCRCCYRC